MRSPQVSARHTVPCPFLSFPSFAFTTVSSRMSGEHRPDAKASNLRSHLPDLVVDTRQSAWHPQPTGAWTMVGALLTKADLALRRATDTHGAAKR